MKTIDAVIEQCEEIANASKQHTLHMTHFSQSYDEWAEEWTQIAEWLKELKAYRENTCGDAISRQAVLDAMYELCGTGETLKENPWRDNPHIDAITDAIENLPSVTPQQRTGRWKFIVYDANRIGHYECSECHWNVLMNVSAYCPHCGTKMEVEE